MSSVSFIGALSDIANILSVIRFCFFCFVVRRLRDGQMNCTDEEDRPPAEVEDWSDLRTESFVDAIGMLTSHQFCARMLNSFLMILPPFSLTLSLQMRS